MHRQPRNEPRVRSIAQKDCRATFHHPRHSFASLNGIIASSNLIRQRYNRAGTYDSPCVPEECVRMSLVHSRGNYKIRQVPTGFVRTESIF